MEPIIQSEVSRKEKHQYMYMEFRKMVMITLYARQQKRLLDSMGEGKGGMI